MKKPVFIIPEDYIMRYYNDTTDLPDYRSTFMRDRDRVMYCTAFRRLAGKTQIYTIGSDDHKKNRLTHSLEVAQIARTIALALGLDEALAEAIALGHDFGHTPFGHAGEQMLHQIMIPKSKYVKYSPFFKREATDISNVLAREGAKSLVKIDVNNMFGFKHNIQSVRVASTLEDNYRGRGGENIGLNLTNYTLWGMMHHSSCNYNTDDSYPNYQRQFDDCLSIINNSTKEAWSFEAYIVKWSDDIAQWHHDLEDAMRGNALPIKKICDTIRQVFSVKLADDDKNALKSIQRQPRIDRKCIADLSHIVVNTLVNDIVETSRKNLNTILTELKDKLLGKPESEITRILYSDYDVLGLSIHKENVIHLSPVIQYELFKDIIKGPVHHSRDVERMNEKGKYIIRKLFEAYYSHPQQLPDGCILHFMVDTGHYKTIDKAKSIGMGVVRTDFESVMKNPPLLYESILMRRICDHIASMTDRYAIKEYNNLYG